MHAILFCVTQAHDQWLLTLAAIVCTLGIYASSAIAAQAGRSEARARQTWALVSIVACGCTAWSTHMIALLAFRPGMGSGFDPWLTVVSLLAAIFGITAGVGLSLGQRKRWRRFIGGAVLGLGITALHYLGQASYLVTGRVSWDMRLVAISVPISLGLFGFSLVIAGERDRALRRFAPLLLLVSIAVLHLCGMTAASMTYDPTVTLPVGAVSPSVIAPILAAVCFGLLALAFMGFRMTMAARARQRRDQERLRELASLALEGLAVCDGGFITLVNQSLERLSGRSGASLTGGALSALLPGLVVEELPEQEERDAELITSEGQRVPVRVLRKEVSLGHKRQTVVAVRDQRERLSTEARMRALAFTDALTGLPNRARLGDLLDHRVAAMREGGAGFVVQLINLDRFKLVNETLGPGSGDALLRIVAARLQAATGEEDVVARLGGDEFVVLQTATGEAADPQRLAERIVEMMARPFLLDGQPVNIGASVGLALAPMNGNAPDVLLRNADLAMRQAKAEGKATFRLFDPALAERVEARRILEADMRAALEVGSFELHYQPLVDPASSLVTGAEALVRWNHPKRGLVSPADFIPLAEETGLIAQLGEWVLRTACRDAMGWPGALKVAVNLSPIQFRDDRLPDLVRAVLAKTGLSADRLELEITEGVLLHDEHRTLAMLSKLRMAGVGIAMDDFGTGYASLSYLRRFPFSKIKIDRSFVSQLPADTESAAIVRAILTMAACLGMTTTVEGVETPAQYAFVAAERCGQIQGYYVSRPLPLSRFLEFLTTRNLRGVA